MARNNLAQLDSGQIKPAIEQFQQALQAVPTDQTAAYHLVVAYRWGGQRQKAFALTKELAGLAAQSQRERATNREPVLARRTETGCTLA